MHTATQLSREQFTAEIDGAVASVDDVLPGWTSSDRLGVVVVEPFGGLGVSVLVQAAVTMFYDREPARRTERAQYPEVYLVHVGGPWGDHSMLDFWPARKECVADADPFAVLAAVNDRAITRLLVPDIAPLALEPARAPSAGFSELASARDRLTTCLAYDASGTVAGGGVVMTASGAAARDNALAALDPEGLVAEFAEYPPSGLDDLGWREDVARRADEIDHDVRHRLAERFTASLVVGVRRETYRLLSVDDALARLAP